MSVTDELTFIVYMLACFGSLFVCMIISFAKTEKKSYFLLAVLYEVISLLLIYGLLSKLFGR